jgi:hypothetical protein
MGLVDRQGNLFILSSAHVIAPQGAKRNDPILQPGVGDIRVQGEIVARLWRRIQHLDAAIAIVETKRPLDVRLFKSDAVVKEFRPPKVGTELEKSGRSTGVTRGKVMALGSFPGHPDAFFSLSVVGDGPISLGGDSGAVWYDPATGAGVGLHYGGENGSNAIAVRLERIVTDMRMDLKVWNGTWIT